jgi:hypothetical protein
MYYERLKFQQSHQCPQCGDLVKGGFNVPSVSLDWVCQECYEKEWAEKHMTISDEAWEKVTTNRRKHNDYSA